MIFLNIEVLRKIRTTADLPRISMDEAFIVSILIETFHCTVSVVLNVRLHLEKYHCDRKHSTLIKISCSNLVNILSMHFPRQLFQLRNLLEKSVCVAGETHDKIG